MYKNIKVKDNIIERMKIYFEEDQERISHALKVLSFAEKLISIIQEKKVGGNVAEYKEESTEINPDKINPEVIIYSAILHDIGIKNAEKKYNSSAPKYQEIEGPPVAREILKSLKIDQNIIDEICEIIANHHSPGNVDTYNFKLLYDADWLVNLPDVYDLSQKNSREKNNIIENLYLTDPGKKLAAELF